MTTQRRVTEIVAIVACALASSELTRVIARMIGIRWGGLAFCAMWIAICVAAAIAWRMPPRWIPARSAWSSRMNLVVLAVVLVCTDFLYGFKVARIIALQVEFWGAYSFWFAVNAIVAAPVAEELLFRGVLWDAIRTRSSSLVALVVTSTLFGVFHWISIFQPSWVGSGGTPLLMHIAFGALMGILRWRFEAIGIGLVLHAFYNGLYVFTG
jgi:membrane protease YdiL (CAAX protease family)